jgi:hypothetical protein
LNQLRTIREELGAGVISLDFEIGDNAQATEATMRHFAQDVLPGMHDL